MSAAPGRRVVIWRHGQTAWNVDNRFQGHLDIGLDQVGHDQAVRAARLLAAIPPAAVVCSDLARARETAEPLLRVTGLQATYDAGLRETHGGQWQGLTGAEITSVDPDVWESWRRGADIPAGHTGERRAEVGERAAAVVRAALTERADGDVLVVVTHGGTARGLIGEMTGLPLEHWGVVGGLANCAWSALEETPDGRWLLEEHNAGSLPTPVETDVL